MLAVLHLMIWIKQRPGKIYLWSSLMAAAAAANAVAELSLLHTITIERYVLILRLENLAVAIMLISMVWFVYLRLKTTRRWLAHMITAMWMCALIPTFLSAQGLVFVEINELKRLTTFWGESYTIALGGTNPWKWIADAASVLILVYVFDASFRLWRQGDRDRALLVGGSIILFIVFAGIHTPLVDAGIIATPYMVSLTFLAIVLALSYDLVNEVVKVPRISRELQITRRETERVMRANILGELSSSMAHELSQPLAAILSNAQAAQRLLAKDPPGKGELRDILEDITQDDKRASEIIHRLRRMLVRGEIQRERFSINTALDEVIAMMRSDLQAHNVVLRMSQNKNLPVLNAGRIEIQQVIMNLMLNAFRSVEHNKVGDRRINVETGLANGDVRLTIEDSGSGIDADKIDRVFEPFFSTHAQGLGIGLAISRRIVENHDGQIQAENREQGGARLWFTLPPAERGLGHD